MNKKAGKDLKKILVEALDAEVNNNPTLACEKVDEYEEAVQLTSSKNLKTAGRTALKAAVDDYQTTQSCIDLAPLTIDI